MLDHLQRLSQSAKGRAAIAVVCTILMLQCYSLVNRTFEHKIDFMLPIDEMIPFIPWTVFVYQSLYIMVLVAAIVCDGEEFLRIMGAMLIIELTSFCFFAVLTAHYPRPPLESFTSEFWKSIYTFLHGSDGPGNTFPSIHASMAFIMGWRLRIQKNQWFWVVWGTVVAISTTTVKQHYVVDVISGLALAIIVHALVFGKHRINLRLPESES